MLHWSYLVEKEWLQQCDSEVNHGVITTSRYMYQTTQTTTLQKEAASDVEQKSIHISEHISPIISGS